MLPVMLEETELIDAGVLATSHADEFRFPLSWRFPFDPEVEPDMIEAVEYKGSRFDEEESFIMYIGAQVKGATVVAISIVEPVPLPTTCMFCMFIAIQPLELM